MSTRTLAMRRKESRAWSTPKARPPSGYLATALASAAAVTLALATSAALALPPTNSAAQIALWHADALALEHGEGVPRDGARAAAQYCQAARLGDAASLYNLGWMLANGRGVPRDDAQAAWFFAAAAERGDAQALRMLGYLGTPATSTPECMRAPEPPPEPVVAQATPAPTPPTPVPVVRDLPPHAPRSIVELVRKLAPRFQLDPHLVLAIMAAESNFDPDAVSPKNAQGLMQLIPDTAARFNVRDPFDPAQSIRGGMAYLRWLLAYFEGNVTLVAAAYNAGERTVERYLGVPPYPETHAYIKRIRRFIGDRSLPFDARVVPPSPALTQMRVVAAKG